MLSDLDIGAHRANVQFRWFCRMACCLPPIWKEREGVTNEEVSLEWRWREKKTLFLLFSNNNTFRWAIFPWCIAFDVHSLGCFTFFRPHFIVFSVSHKDIRALQEWKSQTRRAKKWGGEGGDESQTKHCHLKNYEAENFHSLNCRNKCLLCERESFLVSLLSFSLWLRLLIENAAAQNNNLHDSKDVNTFQNTPMGFEFFPLTIGAIAPKLSKCKLFPHTNRNCQTRKSTNNNGRERREEKKIMP